MNMFCRRQCEELFQQAKFKVCEKSCHDASSDMQNFQELYLKGYNDGIESINAKLLQCNQQLESLSEFVKLDSSIDINMFKKLMKHLSPASPVCVNRCTFKSPQKKRACEESCRAASPNLQNLEDPYLIGRNEGGVAGNGKLNQCNQQLDSIAAIIKLDTNINQNMFKEFQRNLTPIPPVDGARVLSH